MMSRNLYLLIGLLGSCSGDDKGEDECEPCFDKSTSLPSAYKLWYKNWACADDPTIGRMQIKVDGSNVFLSNLVVLLDGDDVSDVVDEAIADWHAQGADISFDTDIGPTTASTAEIFSQEEASDDDAGAVSGVSCDVVEGTTCEMKDCTLIVMGNVLTESAQTTNPIAWVTVDPPIGEEHSLSYTITHELGHVLGLDNQGKTYSGTSIMYENYASGTTNIGVQSADGQALHYMYGAAP